MKKKSSRSTKLVKFIGILKRVSYFILLFVICTAVVEGAAKKGKTTKPVKSNKNVYSGDKVVYFDNAYLPTSLVENPESTVSYLEGNWFQKLDANQLKDWMDLKISTNAVNSVCVMTMGMLPDTVAETMDDKSTIYKYLNEGGKIVWIGDTPFRFQGHPLKNPTDWGIKGLYEVIGVEALDVDLFDSYVEITDKGTKMGMEVVDIAKLPVIEKNMTVILSKTDKYACSWFKNINSAFPNSGFLRYRATWYDGADSSLNEDVYYLAVGPKTIRVSGSTLNSPAQTQQPQSGQQGQPQAH